MLADSKSPWSFDFTYDGNGESKRELHVDSEGVASILVAGQGDVKSGQRSHKLSSWQTAELAHLIDDTGLLCQSTQVRRNIVMDIGRFTAIVHSDRMPPHTLTIDECRYIPDSAALAEILDLLGRTNSLLAEPTEWGPAGTITLEEHCGPTEPN
jgi:ribosomal protein S28E/S33